MALTVLQVVPSLNEGGVERGTLEIGKALVTAGHRSIVLSGKGRLVEQLINDGSEHIQGDIGKKSLTVVLWIKRLRKLIVELQVDILHARSRLPAWICYFALRGLPRSQRPRFVTTVHGLYSISKYSAVMTKADAVISVSNTVKRYIYENYPRVEKRVVHLIFRCVDTNQFPYNYRPDDSWLSNWYNRYPTLKDRFVVTLPGRLSRQKGHEEFIRIIAKAVRDNLPISGLVVGDINTKNDYIDSLMSAVKDQHLPVIFSGHRKDIREIYAISDVVLSLAAKPESFGRTVLEPLSLGVPVIGYNHGGVGEILAALFPQGLVSPHDLVELYQTILAFNASPPFVPETHLFSLETMQMQTLELYESLAVCNSK